MSSHADTLHFVNERNRLAAELKDALAENQQLREALRRIELWPFDVNAGAVDDLRDIKLFAIESLAAVVEE